MDFDLKLAIQCSKSFSVASRLGSTLFQADGTVLYHEGYSCAACKMCQKAGLDNEKCSSAHMYGMHEAERFGGKYIYFCAMGLTCFTTTILASEHSVAQLTIGPFLMVDEQDYIDYDLRMVLKLSPETVANLESEIRRIPRLEASRVSAMAEILFMSVAFISNVSESNRLLELSAANAYQGQISTYIHSLKHSEPAEPYPFRMERQFLKAVTKGDSVQAQQQLNELLGYILFSYGGDCKIIHCRINELLSLMSRIAVESGVDSRQVLAITASYYNSFSRSDDVEQLCYHISSAMHKFMDAILADSCDRHSTTIHRAVQYMQAHYAEKLSLEAIAHALSISQYYLSRLFCQITGVPLMKFLNQLRIEKSKQLLTETNLSISEVAQRCGFEDQSYFSNVFKRLCAESPLAFRRNRRKASKDAQRN